MVLDDQRTYIAWDLDLTTNSSIKYEQFSRLSQANKCTKLHKWFNYLFLECRNHLLYIDSN